MGIANITPDSFSDGGHYNSTEQALEHIDSMITDGADIIDVGAESTRPGSDPVSVDEEIRRLEPILAALKTKGYIVSLDTSKPDVAAMGLNYGVSIINDVKGISNPAMWELLRDSDCDYVTMHMQQTPKTMQENPQYTDVINDIVKEFQCFFGACPIERSRIILDPGIGFGKTVKQNCQILAALNRFEIFECPILIGTSRKSFIGQITGDSVENRLEGTIASSVIAVMNGASILRNHDVKSIKRAVLVSESIRASNDT